MLAPVLTLTLVAALLQSAPAESGLLASVPADADVAVRVRGVEQARDDLLAMIKAMSPALGDQASAGLEQGVASFSQMFGADASRSPFLAVMRIAPPAEAGRSPFVVLVPGVAYDELLASLNGGKAPALEKKDGLDSFKGPGGDTVYARSVPGGVAFGPDLSLIKSLGVASGAGLDKALAGPLGATFDAGDVGVYANVSALQDRFKDQIVAAREQFMAALDQAGQQAGNAGMMDYVKKLYGGMFDALQYGQAMTLSIDAAAAGLAIDSTVTVKPDSKAAKLLAGAESASTETIEAFPADSSYYIFMNLNADAVQQMQAMSMSMMAPSAKATAETEKLLQAMRGLGKIRAAGHSGVGATGLRSVNETQVSDPKSYIESSLAISEQMKSVGEGPLAVIKDVKMTRDAQKYNDFSLNMVEVAFDMEKLAQAQANPAGADSIKGMFGGDVARSWVGTDGKTVLTVNSPTWEEARATLDAHFKPASTIGATPGFQAVRRALPAKVNLVFLMSAQGLVRQISAQLGSVLGGAKLQVPPDMPTEPALLGVAMEPVPMGVHVKLVVPSQVGPVFEKGLVPMIQSMQGRVNN